MGQHNLESGREQRGEKEWEAEQGENGGREAKAGWGSRREQRRAQREQREKGREEWEWEGRGGKKGNPYLVPWV